MLFMLLLFFFFFNDTATTEIYTLSLHDALPIWFAYDRLHAAGPSARPYGCTRSEEHTSELQSRVDISYAVFCLKKNTRLNSSHEWISRLPSSACKNAHASP